MLWNFSHLIDSSAVSYFDQQVVLCNTGTKSQGLKSAVAPLNGDLRGISTQNQDLCYSDHNGSETDAVITRNLHIDQRTFKLRI